MQYENDLLAPLIIEIPYVVQKIHISGLLKRNVATAASLLINMSTEFLFSFLMTGNSFINECDHSKVLLENKSMCTGLLIVKFDNENSPNLMHLPTSSYHHQLKNKWLNMDRLIKVLSQMYKFGSNPSL
jgi:hypothetical protein